MEAPETGSIRLERDGVAASLVIDRPAKRNALTLAMLEQLEAAVAVLEADRDVRVVVLRAIGERAFCVGADIAAWGSLVRDDPVAMWLAWDRMGHRVLDRLAALPVPVIAALHGHVLGGGLELALAADIRIATSDAALGLPEVRVGATPGWGASRRLPALIGPARAKQLALTGEPIDAATAAAWGLVNEVVTPARLAERVGELASAVTAGAPVAVSLAKAAFDGAAGSGTVLALEGLAGAVGAATEDGREGPAAFAAKRRPTWRGR